jgi:hypothetical protein
MALTANPPREVDLYMSCLSAPVWELEGPTPILNRSKKLIAIVDLRAAAKVSGIHPIVGARNQQGVSDFDP